MERRAAQWLLADAWRRLETALRPPEVLQLDGATLAVGLGVLGLWHDAAASRVHLCCPALGLQVADDFRIGPPLLRVRQWQVLLRRTWVAAAVASARTGGAAEMTAGKGGASIDGHGPRWGRLTRVVTLRLWQRLDGDGRFAALRNGGLHAAAGIDVRLLEIARRSRAPRRGTLHVVDANLAMPPLASAAFASVAREAPPVLPLLRAALLRCDLQLAPGVEPLQDLRALLIARSGGDSRVWKRALKGMREIGHFWRALESLGNYFELICRFYGLMHLLNHPKALRPSTVRSLCAGAGWHNAYAIDGFRALPPRLWRSIYQAAARAPVGGTSAFNRDVERVVRWHQADQAGFDALDRGWAWMVSTARSYTEATCGAAEVEDESASPSPPSWRFESRRGPIDAVPLRRALDIHLEARWARNCIPTYTAAVLRGDVVLVSLRSAVTGQRLATLGLRRDVGKGGWVAFDLRFRFNQLVFDAELLHIAYQVTVRMNA